MTWVRLDDGFLDHPKFLRAGPLASYLNICAIAWSNRNQTDGLIPASQVGRLVAWHGIGHNLWQGEIAGGGEDVEPEALAERLVQAGLWEEEGEDFRIHDYLDYQPSATTIRRKRVAVSKARATAGKRGGKAQANAKQNGSKVEATPEANVKQTSSK